MKVHYSSHKTSISLTEYSDVTGVEECRVGCLKVCHTCPISCWSFPQAVGSSFCLSTSESALRAQKAKRYSALLSSDLPNRFLESFCLIEGWLSEL